MIKKDAKKFINIRAIFFIFAVGFISSLAYAEDYNAYAQEQAAREKTVIAPYTKEIAELQKQVIARQEKPDVQNFIAEVKRAASGQGIVTSSHPNPRNSPVLIFVSFSMSQESLRGWLVQAQKINAPIYIRGLVNNSFKDTTVAVSQLIQNQKGGLLIDPPLFKKYAIKEVPAVVVPKGDDFDVIYGDVTLDYALTKIETVSPNNVITQDIQILRGRKNA